MKKVMFLSLMAMLMLSCTKEPSDLIVGKWKWVNAEKAGQAVTIPEGLAWIIEFQKDGSFTETIKDGSYEGTNKGTYKINDKILTLQLEGGASYINCEIQKLDKKEFIFSIDKDGAIWTYYFARQ